MPFHFAPAIDADEIEKLLEVIQLVCEGGESAGAIGRLPQRSRFYWFVAARSTVIESSPVNSGLCAEPQTTLDDLLERMVRLTQ